MKINLAKSAGFCFGVKRALKIAQAIAKSGEYVEMLGDIVHNEDVVKEIKNAGIKKIKRLGRGQDKTLLIRAHGTSKDIIKRAHQSGYKIIDATCPMVKEIHKIARHMEKKGYKIIIIGDKKHDEVHGIIGQLKTKAIVIDCLQRLPWEKMQKIKKACVVVQSTQSLDKSLKIAKLLKPYFRDLKFYNTICRPTRMKQEEIKKMPQDNDVIIIIGSNTSANTRRLYEISKSLNPHSYWVRSKTDIKPDWFRGAQSVGITAGASTPDSTTEGVIAHIKQIT